MSEFELPVLNDFEFNQSFETKTPKTNQNVFDFSSFAKEATKEDKKQDIKRFLNEHFMYIGKDLDEK